MTKSPISWVTGDIQLSFAPCTHIVRSPLEHTIYPGYPCGLGTREPTWRKSTTGKAFEQPKEKHGSRCCRKKQVISLLFLLTFIFRYSNWFSLSISHHWVQDILTLSSVSLGFYQPGTYKKRWPSSSYPFLEFHPQRVRRGFTTGAFLILLNKVNCPAFLVKAGTPA